MTFIIFQYQVRIITSLQACEKLISTDFSFFSDIVSITASLINCSTIDNKCREPEGGMRQLVIVVLADRFDGCMTWKEAMII